MLGSMCRLSYLKYLFRNKVSYFLIVIYFLFIFLFLCSFHPHLNTELIMKASFVENYYMLYCPKFVIIYLNYFRFHHDYLRRKPTTNQTTPVVKFKLTLPSGKKSYLFRRVCVLKLPNVHLFGTNYQMDINIIKKNIFHYLGWFIEFIHKSNLL